MTKSECDYVSGILFCLSLYNRIHEFLILTNMIICSTYVELITKKKTWLRHKLPIVLISWYYCQLYSLQDV